MQFHLIIFVSVSWLIDMNVSPLELEKENVLLLIEVRKKGWSRKCQHEIYSSEIRDTFRESSSLFMWVMHVGSLGFQAHPEPRLLPYKRRNYIQLERKITIIRIQEDETAIILSKWIVCNVVQDIRSMIDLPDSKIDRCHRSMDMSIIHRHRSGFCGNRLTNQFQRLQGRYETDQGEQSSLRRNSGHHPPLKKPVESVIDLRGDNLSFLFTLTI